MPAQPVATITPHAAQSNEAMGYDIRGAARPAPGGGGGGGAPSPMPVPDFSGLGEAAQEMLPKHRHHQQQAPMRDHFNRGRAVGRGPADGLPGEAAGVGEAAAGAGEAAAAGGAAEGIEALGLLALL